MFNEISLTDTECESCAQPIPAGAGVYRVAGAPGAYCAGCALQLAAGDPAAVVRHIERRAVQVEAELRQLTGIDGLCIDAKVYDHFHGTRDTRPLALALANEPGGELRAVTKEGAVTRWAWISEPPYSHTTVFYSEPEDAAEPEAA